MLKPWLQDILKNTSAPYWDIILVLTFFFKDDFFSSPHYGYKNTKTQLETVC